MWGFLLVYFDEQPPSCIAAFHFWFFLPFILELFLCLFFMVIVEKDFLDIFMENFMWVSCVREPSIFVCLLDCRSHYVCGACFYVHPMQVKQVTHFAVLQMVVRLDSRDGVKRKVWAVRLSGIGLVKNDIVN